MAALLLVVASPAVLAGMALVKLTSRGPPLFAKARGPIWTRLHDLEAAQHVPQLRETDRSSLVDARRPRVTRVGRALRALHIDELPQLINVLRGQMSLIGPRPERPEIAAKLSGIIEDYNSRHAVLPGISGNAQIHLPPDTTVNDVRDKLILDREYIQRFSAWFDVKMLALTGLKMVGLYRTKNPSPTR